MPLQVVYSPEPTPEAITKSVFLVGPSPRNSEHANWRPEAMDALERHGFDGTVFIPLPRDGAWPDDYSQQVTWERKHLDIADVSAAWIPRELPALPGFTTNVEFGELLSTGRLIYGRPPRAPHTRYLDHRYRIISADGDEKNAAPCESLDELARRVVGRLGTGATRRGGERFVPLDIWNTSQFQNWYSDLQAAGNRLEEAQVLWTYRIPQANNFLFCFALQVNVWIEREQRFKSNEFIVSRPDTVSVCAFARDALSADVLDTSVVLIREFRAPGRTADGFLRELPGGSSFHGGENELVTAAHELEEETGLSVAPARFRRVSERQMAGTFGTHRSHLFAVELSEQETRVVETAENTEQSFGVAEDTERTQVELRTVRQIFDNSLLDHANLGMIAQVLLARDCDAQ